MFHCYLCSNHTWGNNSQILEKITMGLGKAIQRNNRKQQEGRRYSLDFKANESIFCPLEEDGGRQEKKGEANVCCFCWHRCLSPIFTFSPSCSPQKWPTLMQPNPFSSCSNKPGSPNSATDTMGSKKQSILQANSFCASMTSFNN